MERNTLKNELFDTKAQFGKLKQKNAALKERVQELEGLARHENEDWLRLVEVLPALNSAECYAKIELFLIKKEEVLADSSISTEQKERMVALLDEHLAYYEEELGH